MIRGTVCRDAVKLIEEGCSAQEASEKSLAQVLELTGGRGGIILIDNQGNAGFAFNTGSMAWACVSPNERRSGLRPGENNCF